MIALIPVVGRFIIAGVSLFLALFVKTGFLVAASLTSCLILFVFPLMLLGSVSPALVKFAATNLDSNGKTVGELNALNTIGSIIGTFTPTFVTIPTVGTSVTFFIFAGVLALLAALYFFWQRGGLAKKQIAKTVLCLFLVVACGVGSFFGSFAFWQSDLIYEGESVYNYLQVYDDEEAIYFSTNVLFGIQSMQMKDGGLTHGYYDYDLAAPLMAGLSAAQDKSAFNVLILGLATGTFATQCLQYYGDVHIEGVEIDGKIVDVAQEYFNLPDAVETIVSDGRAYLFSGPGKDRKYDVILVDAYQDITIPAGMSSIEFFRLVADHLTERGVMVLNMNMYSDDEKSINAYLSDTVAAVFPYVYNAKIQENRELFAAFDAGALDRLEAGIATVTDTPLRGALTTALAKMRENGPYVGGDLILTDDKAPVELLGIKLVDAKIGEELDYYRAVYRRGGFAALWKSLT